MKLSIKINVAGLLSQIGYCRSQAILRSLLEK